MHRLSSIAIMFGTIAAGAVFHAVIPGGTPGDAILSCGAITVLWAELENGFVVLGGSEGAGDGGNSCNQDEFHFYLI